MEKEDITVFQGNDVPMSQANLSDPSYPVAYELELHRVIELAAYFLAEKDGFRRSQLDYWLAAEQRY
jgi:hypothetical protein